MEVHHHPNVEKKRFKEYILEFIMIFLAVTLGFFAENIRERIKNNEEIKSDMQSMVGDLRSDMDMFNSYVASNQFSDRRIDTLITFLKLDRSNTPEIYFLARYITVNNNTYTPSTKTFDQMKSSGALKLIRPRRLLDSISNYYQSLQFFPLTNALQNQKLTDIHLVNGQLFDGYTFQKMLHVIQTENGFTKRDVNRPEGNPPLLSNNFNVINSVITAYHYLYAVTEVNNSAAIIAKKNADKLMNLLNKEYSLK